MSESTENNIFKIALNLILTCLVSGLIIGCVYYITGPIAKVKAEQMKQDSMRALVPDAEKFAEVPGEKDTYFAQKDGKMGLILPDGHNTIVAEFIYDDISLREEAPFFEAVKGEETFLLKGE